MAGSYRPNSSNVRAFGVVLERLTRRGPLLLAVDDAEDADTASLAVLLHVLRTAEGLPLAVVLTAHARAGEAQRSNSAVVHAIPERQFRPRCQNINIINLLFAKRNVDKSFPSTMYSFPDSIV